MSEQFGLNSQKIRWGILGAAKIAREHLIPAIDKSECATLVAVSSRSVDKARGLGEALGIRYHGSYEALLADPEVDAIYNPLPNDLHVEWSIKALQAGKHVLCEKPLGLDAKDVSKLVKEMQNFPALVAMEAFMYRSHPQWLPVKQLLEDRRIGRVRTV